MSRALSLGLVAVLGVALAGCQSQSIDAPQPGPVGRSAAALTAEQCMESAVGGKSAICHRTLSEPPYVRIVLAEKACINAHAQNHAEDFLDTTGDCACVGDGQGCQAGAPCCSGHCDAGTNTCSAPPPPPPPGTSGDFVHGGCINCLGGGCGHDTPPHGTVTITRPQTGVLVFDVVVRDTLPSTTFHIEIFEASAVQCASDNGARPGVQLTTDGSGDGHATVTLPLPWSPPGFATLGDGAGTESVIVVLDSGGDVHNTLPIPIPAAP